jgi:hypothetical protein
MSANELLVWMSARSQGSWQQFRAAVEELQLAEGSGSQETEDDSPAMSVMPRYQILRLNFERLGHAEFFAGASPNGWRVTPPTLAAAEGQNGWHASWSVPEHQNYCSGFALQRCNTIYKRLLSMITQISS